MKKVICEQCPCLDHANGGEYDQYCHLGYTTFKLPQKWPPVNWIMASDECLLESINHDGKVFTPVERD